LSCNCVAITAKSSRRRSRRCMVLAMQYLPAPIPVPHDRHAPLSDAIAMSALGHFQPAWFVRLQAIAIHLKKLSPQKVRPGL
ncbi:MAG: hypothetical protein AAGD43_33340, partial [Pseudomonadota bacterium]